jgi:GTP-binding protein
MKPRLPVVAIVGRQNVGKSSLFNRILGRRMAIVDPKPGTTLDRVEAHIRARDQDFVLVDTGGMGMRAEDPYRADVLRQIDYALQAADVIVLLGDAPTGVTDIERDTAARLLREARRVILAVNKVDLPEREADVADFYRLGLGDPVAISVTHNRGIDTLLERIAALLPRAPAPDAPEARIAIVGQRNVGKSTYVNALCGEERVIVSERPGTTRDSVDVVLDRGDRRIVLVDTAGVRKRTKVEDSVELFGQMRTEASIDRADALILLLEAPRPVSKVELVLGRQIEKSAKPCVIALNKWDMIRPERAQPEKFIEYVNRAFPVLGYAPVVVMSARIALNLWEPVEIASELIANARKRVGTGDLNRVIERVLQTAPVPIKGTREGRLLYATQTGVAPPTFVFFVRHKAIFSAAYLKHLARTLREVLPFKEVPIRLVLREKGEERRRRPAGRRRTSR